jgi:hypothetical protein
MVFMDNESMKVSKKNIIIYADEIIMTIPSLSNSTGPKAAPPTANNPE